MICLKSMNRKYIIVYCIPDYISKCSYLHFMYYNIFNQILNIDLIVCYLKLVNISMRKKWTTVFLDPQTLIDKFPQCRLCTVFHNNLQSDCSGTLACISTNELSFLQTFFSSPCCSSNLIYLLKLPKQGSYIFNEEM